MPYVQDLTETDTGEEPTITFDFTAVLPAGGALVGTPAVIVTLHTGTDPVAGSHAVGSPKIGAADNGAANAAVRQKFAGLVGGAVYTMQCLAADATGILSIWTRVSCIAPN